MAIRIKAKLPNSTHAQLGTRFMAMSAFPVGPQFSHSFNNLLDEIALYGNAVPPPLYQLHWI